MVGRVPVELASLVVGDEPSAWIAAGFTVQGRDCRVGAVRVSLMGADGRRGILGWSFRGLAEPVGRLDGLAVGPAEPAPAGEPPPHPNGVIELDHLVLLTPDQDRTVSALADIGLVVRRVREVPEGLGAGPATQTFFRMGRPILELVAPVEPGDGPCRFFGLAFDVADLDALPGRFGERLGTVKQAVQPGRRIATLRTRELDISTPIAFMTPDRRRPPRQ